MEAFDNFEFDIDLLTENHSEDDQDKALELKLLQRQQQPQQQELFVIQQQQQDNKPENSDKATDKQKQQLQLMLEEILFNSNNNNNVSCSSNDNNNNNNTNNNVSCRSNDNNNNNTTNTNNNNNTFKMANGLSDFFNNGDIEDLFNVAPNSQVLDEILSSPMHDMDLSNFSPTMENAVDFNQTDNEGLSLMGLDIDQNTSNSCFINSQPNSVMLSTGISISSQNLNTHPSVAALSQEILVAEPYIPTDMIYNPHSSYTAEPISTTSNFIVLNDSSQYIDDDAMDCNELKLEAATNPLKRNSSQMTQKHLQEKRMKLRLDIKQRPKDIDTQSQELNTPAIIQAILQNDEVIFTRILYSIHTYMKYLGR